MKNYSDQLSVLYQDRLEKLTNDDYPDEYKESLDEFTTLCKEIEAALPKDRGRQIMLELDSIPANVGTFQISNEV